jgi:beta-xylosidase
MGYQNCTESKGLIPPYNCPGIYTPFGGCGFRTDHSVNLYTSTDLMNWTYRGNVFPTASRPVGIYFRPKVIYNRQTSRYLLWINRLSPADSPLAAYPNATYLVASSPYPFGPFTTVREAAEMGATGGGDFTLLVDTDGGSAYIAYDAWSNNHKVGIEQLSTDFTNSMGSEHNHSTGPISRAGNEAPILFSRKGWYYLLYGPTCCFCTPGSGSVVWTARHPLGPWVDSGVDLNPERGGASGRLIKAQENFVITLHHNADADGGSSYIYTGDRWESAPDRLKGHDLQYWQPLRFNDSRSPPTIAPLTWDDSFQIKL